MKQPGRLVVVSNRVPETSEPRAGGLAIALQSVMAENGGLWFGWSGDVSPHGGLHRRTEGNIDYLTIDLCRADYDDYYASFSNQALWPLLHFRADLADFTAATLAGYRRVNRKFALALLAELRPDDTVWVHDYHLIPLAAMLRDAGATQRIGFFLHVPFPTIDVLSTMPGHAEFFASLSAYDLVGVQTADDLQRLSAHAGNGRPAMPGPDVPDVEMEAICAADGTTFAAGAFPISIATQDMAERAQSSPDHADVRRLADAVAGAPLILGVDRLDYSKGLPQRLAAYRAFLRDADENAPLPTFVQITPLSRAELPAYRQLRVQLDRAARDINRDFPRRQGAALHYLNESFGQATLAGVYRMARVGLVTPLCDGMNLVAKEFVACQNPEDPGVLILSRFAGAARELTDALIVDPFDERAMADAIALALRMPLAERKRRWQRMMDRLTAWNIDAWSTTFLRVLTRGDTALETNADADVLTLVQRIAREDEAVVR